MPVATSPLRKPDPDGEISLQLPVDTSTRGDRPIGPYTVVHGDPWSIVRRMALSCGGRHAHRASADDLGSPLGPTGPSAGATPRARAAGEGKSTSSPSATTCSATSRERCTGARRRGRESSSSSSRWRPAPNNTMIVLDTDASAYGSDDQFTGGWVDERFESAVEVAASLAIAQADRVEQVHVVTTARGASLTSATAGSTDAFLDAFAVALAVPPVETAPEESRPARPADALPAGHAGHRDTGLPCPGGDAGGRADRRLADGGTCRLAASRDAAGPARARPRPRSKIWWPRDRPGSQQARGRGDLCRRSDDIRRGSDDRRVGRFVLPGVLVTAAVGSLLAARHLFGTAIVLGGALVVAWSEVVNVWSGIADGPAARSTSVAAACTLVAVVAARSRRPRSSSSRWRDGVRRAAARRRAARYGPSRWRPPCAPR